MNISMDSIKNHIINIESKLSDALIKINNLPEEGILFVVDQNKKLFGSITDGDIRRVLLNNNMDLNNSVKDVMNATPKFIYENKIDVSIIKKLRKDKFKIIPVVDADKRIVELINFQRQKTLLPLDVVIMAGGLGKRLRPLTYKTPKPLIKVNGIPMIDHKINSLLKFGINKFWISINYLGHKIKKHIENSKLKNYNYDFIEENIPLGTIGAVSRIDHFDNENVLITNADLITNVNFEDFYLNHLSYKSDITVLSIPYKHDVPYAVLETNKNKIVSFKEKPIIEYLTNGGIYIIKSKHLKLIPKNTFYNATDLIELLISKKLNVNFYQHNGIWKDVGNYDDYQQIKNNSN